MATLRRAAIKVRSDENIAADNLRKVQIGKNLKTSTIDSTKRAALGELGNRTATTISIKGKDVQLKDNLKDTKQLRNVVKPRVDSYWKKSSVLATKPLTRTDSLKSINTNATGTLSTVQLKRSSSVKSIVDFATTSASLKSSTHTVRHLTRQVTAAAATTKVITTKPVITIKPKKDDIPSTLRREDSNLSKRSITKLRAALSKDHKKDAIKIIAANNNNKITIEETTTKQIQRVKIKESEIVSHSVQMINLIENIDINDTDSVIMVPEYVNDIYSYLYNLEILFPIEFDCLKKQMEVTPRMRSVLLDWINEVSHQFHLIPETYQMTVGIIDRYLQAVPTTTRKNLQLVGVTAIFIAAKYEELYPSDIGDFVYITDSTYNKSQILAMEKQILKSIDFQLCRPIPIIFLRRYSKAANAETEQYLCSKYILELVSIEYELAHYKPSEIAAAALYLSMQLFNKLDTPIEKIWTPTLQFYSRYNVDHLNPIVKKIAKIVHGAPQAKEKAVYKKFESNKFDKISTKSELYGPVISKLISSV